MGSARTTAVSLTTSRDPGHREALWELEAAFDRGALITLFGPCAVSYEGRAASALPTGRRLVVLKPDGAALVHTDEGREPVNWQPPGSRHRAAVRDGRLVVRSVRSSPDEELRVVFDRVEQVAAYPVTGRRDVAVTGTEADLRRQILDRPAMVEAGFEPIETERPTDAGAIDLFGYDADDRPVVVELKRRRVGPDAVGQLARYVAAVDREAETDDPRGVLVAPSLTDRGRELLTTEGLEHVPLDPPESSDRSDADGENDETPTVVSDPGAGARTESPE